MIGVAAPSVIGGHLEKSTCLGMRKPTHILDVVDQNRKLIWLKEIAHTKVNVAEFVVNSTNIRSLFCRNYKYYSHQETI